MAVHDLGQTGAIFPDNTPFDPVFGQKGLVGYCLFMKQIGISRQAGNYNALGRQVDPEWCPFRLPFGPFYFNPIILPEGAFSSG